MKQRKVRILFVCLGNICRSPIAHGVFQSLVDSSEYRHILEVDSCGTGHWHVGEPPHRESCRVAKEHGISITQQRARQVKENDFSHFDIIVAMDRQNKRDLEKIRGTGKARIVTLREYDSHKDGADVPDPYYGGPEGFEEVFEIISRSCEELFSQVIRDFSGE